MAWLWNEWWDQMVSRNAESYWKILWLPDLLTSHCLLKWWKPLECYVSVMNFFQHFYPNKLFELHLPPFDPAQKVRKQLVQCKWGLNIIMFSEEHKWLNIYLKIRDCKYTHNMADLTNSYSSDNIAHKTNTNLHDIVLNKLLPLALQHTVGFGLSNNVLPFFPTCHQLSPSSHSQHLKISFFFLFPSFPGSSPSWPFQFLSEDLFGHPILLHSL